MGGPQYDEIGLCWSTYLGDDGFDYAEDIRSDADNNLYVAGRTTSTLLQFPADPGVFYGTSGNTVAFMTKFDSFHQISWTLFFGGDLIYSQTAGTAIAVLETPIRRIFLGGSSKAQDLWTSPNGSAYFDGTNVNSTWKGALLEVNDLGQAQWATYFGEHDVEIAGMAVTGTNNLVICGRALNELPSVQNTPPPNSMNNTYAGGGDAFIAMFDPSRQLFWRTWWGGSGGDIALDVAADQAKIVLSGHTSSSAIDMVDPGNGAYTQPYAGNDDVYVIEYDINGVEQWSTYLGGSGQDHLGLKGLDIGPEGDVLLTGLTPVLNTLVNGPNWYGDMDDGSNGFIARFDGSDRSPKWITYLGSAGSHHPMAIEQDGLGLINITGFTDDHNLPHSTVAGMYDQADVYESGYGAFLVQFKPDQELLHATWYGGDNGTLTTNGRALSTNSDGLFLVGITQKASDPASYFPLDNGQGVPWFDDEFNHLGQSVLGTDAFVTWFCQEITSGEADAPDPAGISPRVLIGPDGLVVLNLVDGPTSYRLFDTTGRLLSEGVVWSASGRTNAIATGQLAPGTYFIDVQEVVPLYLTLR